MNRSLTAVVLNWHTPELTLRAVDALLRDGLPAERLVVVDNESSPAGAMRLKGALPGAATLLTPREHLGFAAANNLGAAALPADDHYIFVNSDAFLARAGTLDALRAAIAVDGGVGVAVPRLLNRDLTLQPSVYPLARPLTETVRAAGLSRLVPDRLRPRLSGRWSHAYGTEIEYAVGAVLVIRARLWELLGGFSERTRMYAEDIDLAWRSRSAGFRMRFVADAEFVHLGGASSSRRWSPAEREFRAGAAEAAILRSHLAPGRAEATLALMAAGTAARGNVRRAAGYVSRPSSFYEDL